MLSPTQNGAKLFPRLRARPGPTDRGPGCGGELMVVVVGRNPGGTARWYSPAGAGTRHLTRGGGSNHLYLLRGKGQNPLEESFLALRSAMASAPLSPCIPHAQPPPCDPRVARTLRRPRAPLLPCPRWLGRDCSWAPGALLRRRLGGRSGCGRPSPLARAGVRCTSGRGFGAPAGCWPAPGRAPSEGVPCFVLRGLAATCH